MHLSTRTRWSKHLYCKVLIVLKIEEKRKATKHGNYTNFVLAKIPDLSGHHQFQSSNHALDETFTFGLICPEI